MGRAAFRILIILVAVCLVPATLLAWGKPKTKAAPAASNGEAGAGDGAKTATVVPAPVRNVSFHVTYRAIVAVGTYSELLKQPLAPGMELVKSSDGRSGYLVELQRFVPVFSQRRIDSLENFPPREM